MYKVNTIYDEATEKIELYTIADVLYHCIAMFKEDRNRLVKVSCGESIDFSVQTFFFGTAWRITDLALQDVYKFSDRDKFLVMLVELLERKDNNA